jgi:hypothetical protein
LFRERGIEYDNGCKYADKYINIYIADSGYDVVAVCGGVGNIFHSSKNKGAAFAKEDGKANV